MERQFPELAPARLEPLGTGWDNAAYVVNGRWVFRFPRRKSFVGLLESEVRLLPRLAPHLPLRIPEPVWHGRPEEAFPYPFAGYELLPGETLSPLNRSSGPASPGSPHTPRAASS